LFYKKIEVSLRHECKENKDKAISSYIEEEVKIPYDKRKDGLKPGQPIVVTNPKMKLLPKRFSSKLSNLWIVNKTNDDGTVKIENPYSRKTKIVVKQMLKRRTIQ